MSKVIVVNNKNYELIKNYRDAFNEDEFIKKCTDYFYDYDYIVGDIAYSKLRLKGFYDNKNKRVKKINNYNNIDKYLEENCAKNCRYFILKRESNINVK